MLQVKAIYDSNNDGWFIRIIDGEREIDSLPPSVALYDGDYHDASNADMKRLAIEAVKFEGYQVDDVLSITRVDPDGEVLIALRD